MEPFKIDGSDYLYALDESDTDEGVKILAFSDVITTLDIRKR